MAQQGTRYPSAKMAAKRAAVLEAKKDPTRRRWLLGLGLAALLAAGAVTFLGSEDETSPAAGKLFTFTPEASGVAEPARSGEASQENSQ